MSLQQALFIAGVRHSITSLWDVPDEATKLLMTRFYEGIWRRGESMREALWNAKLELRTVRSPIDGVVASVSIETGEFVDEDEIMRVVQLDPLHVEVVVPVALYGEIETGTVAEVRPEAPFDRPHEAKVVIVDRVVDAASGTFGLRLELENPKGALPGGLKCRVSF